MRRLLVLLVLGTCLVRVPAHAAGIPIEKASKDQLKAAQRTFEAADGLYDAKRFREAITAYRASYEIVASPNSRLMIARCYAALGQVDDAYYELTGAIMDAKQAAAADKKYAPTLAAAETELANLEPKVGRLTLVLGARLKEAKVNVGPRTLSTPDFANPIVVTPGNVVVVATLPDGRSLRRELTVAAGATEKLELDLAAETSETHVASRPKAPPKPTTPTAHADATKAPASSLRPYAYVAGGVGLAGLATFAVFGLMNKSKFEDLDSRCEAGHCGPGSQSDIDAGRRYQTIANVGLAVGVIGVGVGTTLFLVSSPNRRESATTLGLGVGPRAVTLTGRFQ